MPGTLEIQDSGRTYAKLELTDVSAAGRLNPRVCLSFVARTVPYWQVELTDVIFQLQHKKELIGEGHLMCMGPLRDNGSLQVEFVIPQRFLRFITENLAVTESYLTFEAELKGRGRFLRDPQSPENYSYNFRVDDPPLGEWRDCALWATANASAGIKIPRADWYQKILAPTRNERYIYLEVALPQEDKALAQEWQNTIEHFRSAEKAFALGDDITVFVYLRGALDAMPGAKTRILEGIRNESKRNVLDSLLKATGNQLHGGRHVVMEGSEAGTFPVNRLDAAFAMDLMRVLLSHLSLILSAEHERSRD